MKFVQDSGLTESAIKQRKSKKYNKGEYGLEMPESQTSDQPTVA